MREYVNSKEITTNIFIKNKSLKDGLMQLKMRIKITHAKYPNLIFEINLLNKQKQNIRISPEVRKVVRIIPEYDKAIKYVEKNTIVALNRLIIEKKELSAKNLTDYIYELPVVTNESRYTSHYSQLNKELYFDEAKPLDLTEAILLSDFEEFIPEENDGVLMKEDFDSALEHLDKEFCEKIAQEEHSEMSYIQKYEKGMFDKNNIFEVLGYCWTLKRLNGDYEIPENYRKLIFHLNDFRFNMNPSESVDNFNRDWINDFIVYQRDKGYVMRNFSGYNPLNMSDYTHSIRTGKRGRYSYLSLASNIKFLNKYISILINKDMLPIQLLKESIKIENYISSKSINTSPYTRTEYGLTNDELKKLMNYDFDEKKLNRARDLYLIAVFSGGLRSQELYYEDGLKLKNLDSEIPKVQVFAQKTSKYTDIPLFPQLKEVLARYDNDFPEIDINRSQLNLLLKEIAEILEFNRLILTRNTTTGKGKGVNRKLLKDIFTISTARKTFVSYLHFKGLAPDEIRAFTRHSKTETLKHYLRDYSSNDREEISKKHNLL